MSDTHANTVAFVRETQIPQSPPPATERGIVKWLRENMFSSVLNSILSLLSIFFIFMLIKDLGPWFWNSTWNAENLAECRELNSGACFAVINERWPQFFFGFYPAEERWRPVLAFLLLFPALAPVLFDKAPRALLVVTLLFPFVAYWLIWGGSIAFPLAVLLGFVLAFVIWKALAKTQPTIALIVSVLVLVLYQLVVGGAGLVENILMGILGNPEDGPALLAFEEVESRNIGGFLLTLILGITSISLALPIGILLALGRQSDLIIIKYICVGFIEFIRGVPLITLLFVANVLLAYFLPPGTTFDLILRVVIMVTAFAAAYLAEVVRGGLAALPRGQYEAADSLGLDYWQAMQLIILPQALKISIPGIVNVFIGLFKDTVLVSIISMYDPLGIVQPILADSDWNGILWELYGFVALFFFIFCYAMSQYSRYLEQKLRTDHR
ncbi:amino acid ABC transporter permease [Pontivivens insulae]|uniref:Inner membrane amino-acid ABC transporter permease protein YhdY n=1 Tax=Pontivivens insulae TaxID=1639689 RepID=A0A2R8A667_9RHOB|nr:amino acid ABC transporter permease [Pontivivens insulae]RED17843.1 L-glutamine ABC transporter membrane protein /L-glutamate ABC transporter membrane protein /L-aspartate ABC transporter membrane protein /L-asparagine ABC transporter membrane protein [Pontivivens insulae]SPF27733.1 Inner membrane amino-acid ABC transporter permease protein YhdY [Pontivivens insulae]